MLIVGTVKKSIETIWPIVIVQERFPGLAGRPRQFPKDAGHGPFGNLDAEHLQLAVNPGCPPERIGHNHLFDQASNLDCSGGSAAPPLVHPRQTCPEPAKPLALPADDSVSLDEDQGNAPASPQPESPTQNNRSNEVKTGRFGFR
jgi:hypothetical protein